MVAVVDWAEKAVALRRTHTIPKIQKCLSFILDFLLS